MRKTNRHKQTHTHTRTHSPVFCGQSSRERWTAVKKSFRQLVSVRYFQSVSDPAISRVATSSWSDLPTVPRSVTHESGEKQRHPAEENRHCTLLTLSS